MAGQNQHKWVAAGEHLVWQFIGGIGVPFALACLIVVLKSNGGGMRGLVAGGEIHLAIAVMLFSCIPSIFKGMNAPSKLRTCWQFIGLITILLMLASIVIWSDLSPRQQVEGLHFRMALEGGILAALLAALLSYTMVWRATK